MEFKRITETDFKEAVTYVPIMDKDAFVQHAAGGCIDRVEITVDGDTESTSQMPPFYKDSLERKNRYMMGALVKFYLKKDYEPVGEDPWLMAADDYDRWAGGHVLNQIERMKSVPALRNAAFDLLQDYKMLEKMLNTEVYNMLQVMNDPVTRFSNAMQAQTSPEAMQKSLDELGSLKDRLAELSAAKAVAARA